MSERKGFNSYAATVARMKRLKQTWKNMKYRCYGEHNSKRTQQCYQEKGIEVCDGWKNSFESFYDWAVENGYDDRLTIDRIDPDGNYCPENCRWITFTENRSRGISNSCLALARKRLGLTQTEMAERIGVDQTTVCLWEKNKCRPNVRIIPKVAEAYHVTVEELLAPVEKKEGD